MLLPLPAVRPVAVAARKKGMPLESGIPVRAGPVSRVLFPGRTPGPVIYLGRPSPAVSSNLPPGIGRATLNCRYTRSCNPRDVLPGGIAAPAVGSYPAFSPLPAGITKIPCGRSFSVTLLYPHGYQVVSLRGALCCPDFPLPASAGSDRAGLPRKGNKIRRIPALRLRFPGIGREYPGLPPRYSRPCRARAPGLCRDAPPRAAGGFPVKAAYRRRPGFRLFPVAGYGAACAVSPVPFRHTPSGHTVCPVRNLFCKYWIKLYFCSVPPPFFGAAGQKNIPADGR